jgi:hypothetical protein
MREKDGMKPESSRKKGAGNSWTGIMGNDGNRLVVAQRSLGVRAHSTGTQELPLFPSCHRKFSLDHSKTVVITGTLPKSHSMGGSAARDAQV